MTTKEKGSNLFIVDNSNENWKVRDYLKDWCEISRRIDIATGYFEIGSLLSLDNVWQKVDSFRIILGDEFSRRTSRAFEEAMSKITDSLDASLESAKHNDDFLEGIPAIIKALESKKIECKVYRKEKFHAKAYITHAKLDVVGSVALIGSSNFTYPGLTGNIELNVQITGGQVNALQEWYEDHWQQAEDVTANVLEVIKRHAVKHKPFTVYAKALQEFFRGHEQTASEWEQNQSLIYKELANYQKEGYHAVLKKADKHNGAFLCDGVGLGKTYIGMMLIERFIHDRLNIALFVPKAARKDVWEASLKKYIPKSFGGYSQLKIFNHTDLLSPSKNTELNRVEEEADIIIIDEAHHFRNTGTRYKNGKPGSRYWRMFELAKSKQVFMLTATPINNKLTDLQHMIEIFTQKDDRHFINSPAAIKSLKGHIRTLEKKLERQTQQSPANHGEFEFIETNSVEAEDIFSEDTLFEALVVQRSRTYVQQSLSVDEGDANVIFPKPKNPEVVNYSIKKTYGNLLEMLSGAFNKKNPLFSLSVYNPYAFSLCDTGDRSRAMEMGRRRQVVALIRTMFLKRFESSVKAFRYSCLALFFKLKIWVETHAKTEHEKESVQKWARKNSNLLSRLNSKNEKPDSDDSEETEFEEILSDIKKLNNIDRKEFNVERIILDTIADLDQLADFLDELIDFEPEHDEKLQALITLLKNNKTLSSQKVIIFTEFIETARYLEKNLKSSGIDGVDEIDSKIKLDRSDVIAKFSPYYNGLTSEDLRNKGQDEIRILISTDVLSEGLNLQDATRLINYDLHWNPVRLMQRIGRIDRRMNSNIEQKIIADHPSIENLRGTIMYWNFLPPDELDILLSLYKKVNHKTLRISKTLGIEGGKLFTKNDDYQDIKNFTESYTGKLTPVEKMHLEYRGFLKKYPELESQLNRLPLRIFSGKESISKKCSAVFFCYRLPEIDKMGRDSNDSAKWTLDSEQSCWCLYDLADNQFSCKVLNIIEKIKCLPETQRLIKMDNTNLSKIRIMADRHIHNYYLKAIQAPMGIDPLLICWMELVDRN